MSNSFLLIQKNVNFCKMIKNEDLMEKCNNNHKQELLEALKSCASENCFLYGDIENFSMDSDFMDVWRIRKDNIITSILLRYYKYYVIYSVDSADHQEISDIINENKDAVGISGLEDVVKSFSKFIKFKEIKNMYLAEMNKKTYRGYKPTITPLKAIKEDIDDLFYFQSNIEEFNLTEASRESFGQEILNGTGRFYFVKKDKNIISTATLTAENSLNGMIIGVATDPGYRRLGYAKNCVASLCREMMDEDKSVLLFYDNPNAGVLYKELGFIDINRWAMGEI